MADDELTTTPPIDAVVSFKDKTQAVVDRNMSIIRKTLADIKEKGADRGSMMSETTTERTIEEAVIQKPDFVKQFIFYEVDKQGQEKPFQLGPEDIVLLKTEQKFPLSGGPAISEKRGYWVIPATGDDVRFVEDLLDARKSPLDVKRKVDGPLSTDNLQKETATTDILFALGGGHYLNYPDSQAIDSTPQSK